MAADLFKSINLSLEDVLKNAEEEKKELLKRLRNFCNAEVKRVINTLGNIQWIGDAT